MRKTTWSAGRGKAPETLSTSSLAVRDRESKKFCFELRRWLETVGEDETYLARKIGLSLARAHGLTHGRVHPTESEVIAIRRLMAAE